MGFNVIEEIILLGGGKVRKLYGGVEFQASVIDFFLKVGNEVVEADEALNGFIAIGSSFCNLFNR